MTTSEPPAYTLIGNITRDLVGDDVTPGGASWYGAHVAAALGVPAHVVSAHQSTWPVPGWPPGIGLTAIERPTTVLFSNDEQSRGREQRVADVPAPFRLRDVPAELLRAPLVHLAPVFHDIEPGELGGLSHDRVVVSAQGWLRRSDPSGRVQPMIWRPATKVLRRSWALFLSEEDLKADVPALSYYITHIPVVVLTRGGGGATAFIDGSGHDVFPTRRSESSRTGAGDVLAAAFCCRTLRGDGVETALAYAVNLAAAFVREGLTCLPDAAAALGRD